MPAVTVKRSVPRLKDIAEKVGVSRTAVAKVILGTGGDAVKVGEEKRCLILKAAEEMGYRPNRAARTLVGGASGIIGVLIDSHAPTLAYEYLARLDKLALATNRRLLIGSEHDSLQGVIDHLHDFVAYGVEGVIVLSHDYPDSRKEINRLMQAAPNIVCVGDPGFEGATFVEVDLTAGVKAMVGHMVKRKKMRIAMLLSDRLRRVCKLRYEGYVEGLKKHKRPLVPELVIVDQNAANALEFDYDALVESLVIEHKADAIIAQNDLLAAGLIQALHRRNIRVPQDVAVSGMDDLPMGRFFIPRLTTIRQCPEEVASAAFEQVLSLISNKVPKPIYIKPKLVIRESA